MRRISDNRNGGGRQGKREALHLGTEKLSHTKFPSLHPTLSCFTKFSLELEALRKFWFPVVGGVSGKGRMPMAALSEYNLYSTLLSLPLPTLYRFRKGLFLSTPTPRSSQLTSSALALGKHHDDKMPYLTPA